MGRLPRLLTRRSPGPDLDGALVLVTGAASGIGRATATALAARGSRLVLTDVQPLDDVLAELDGAVVSHRQADLTDPDAVRSFAQQVHRDHGALDVMMNIAGVSAWGTIQAMPTDPTPPGGRTPTGCCWR